MLSSGIEPGVRSRVHNQLVDEEDKLGKDLELLVDIQRHIVDGARRIEAQQLRVRTMQADCHDGAGRSQTLLDGMTESQRLLMKYHQLVEREIGRNRLLEG